MESPLSHFRFAQFQFSLKALNCISLPVYKGSTFRGAFGHAFKKVVCVTRDRVCGTCLLKEKCVYSYVFETPPPSDTSKMRKYPYAPHPFVITPPLEEKRDYREEDTLSFELTLIGKSIDYLPYFIYTFDELGRMGIGKGKGKYQLEEVKGQGLKVKGERPEDEETTIIYSGKDKTLRNSFSVLRVSDLSPITLHLPPSSDLSPFTFHLTPFTFFRPFSFHLRPARFTFHLTPFTFF